MDDAYFVCIAVAEDCDFTGNKRNAVRISKVGFAVFTVGWRCDLGPVEKQPSQRHWIAQLSNVHRVRVNDKQRADLVDGDATRVVQFL